MLAAHGEGLSGSIGGDKGCHMGAVVLRALSFVREAPFVMFFLSEVWAERSLSSLHTIHTEEHCTCGFHELPTSVAAILQVFCKRFG